MKLKNIPNMLSILRILLVFVFVGVFFGLKNPLAAMFVFLVAGATDVIDGYLARRNHWISNLGKILDPVADKLMQCTVLVSLYIADLIPLWFVIPFFAKELFTLIISFIVIRRRSVVIVSKWYGKAAVCLFYATIVVSITCADFLAGRLWLNILVFLPAVVFALAALLAYIKHYASLKHMEKPDKKVRMSDIIKE